MKTLTTEQYEEYRKAMEVLDQKANEKGLTLTSEIQSLPSGCGASITVYPTPQLGKSIAYRYVPCCERVSTDEWGKNYDKEHNYGWLGLLEALRKLEERIDKYTGEGEF